jgi:sucrose-phosphate synthase
MTDWCLITDIDGTLIGDRSTTAELQSALREARAALKRSGHRLFLAVATGRLLDSARDALLDHDFALSEFDALVTAVGAELYLGSEQRPDPRYHERLNQSGFNAALVRDRMAELEFAELQPHHEQFPHKVSYFVADQAKHRARIHDTLAGLPFATTTVFCHDSYLDIAPVNGTKAGAVAHLLDLWGIAPERAVAAGDSGNDASMLMREWHGIVVGNGHAELEPLRAHRTAFFAQAKHAAGVLEGLRALGFL